MWDLLGDTGFEVWRWECQNRPHRRRSIDIILRGGRRTRIDILFALVIWYFLFSTQTDLRSSFASFDALFQLVAKRLESSYYVDRLDTLNALRRRARKQLHLLAENPDAYECITGAHRRCQLLRALSAEAKTASYSP